MNSLSIPQSSHPLTPLEGELLPFAVKQITLTQQEYIELKHQANYWQAQHKAACEREEALKQELQQKEAMIRDLRHRLFGQASEKDATHKPDENPHSTAESKKTKRPRGQQKGQPGHGRRTHPDLPVVKETIELSECFCPTCEKPYAEFLEGEVSEIVEIKVNAFIRKITRKSYKKKCRCPGTPRIITAPVVPKLIPRGTHGISIWENVLLGKFLYYQPLNRILQDLKSYGLPLAQGTLTGGLQKLKPLFQPMYDSIYEQQMKDKDFHCDESRWEVYEIVEGKVGHRWYLWVTKSKSAVYYVMDPTRSTTVPLKHFSQLDSDRVFVICDRYSAYKKLARLNPSIILAFCWAHVRRDFIELARRHPALEAWGLAWVEEIGTLYHLNKQRLEQWEPSKPLFEQSSAFHKCHQALQTQMEKMKSRCDALLQADKVAQSNKEKSPDKLEVAQRKVLTSLQNHWKGLSVFVEHPAIPMDNNPAERALRGPINGRKDYYGSGAIWSATLAAMMFTIFQTLLLWKLNPRTWLRLYLESCALLGGKVPEDLSAFLPWTMSEERRQELSKPPQSSEFNTPPKFENTT